MLSFKLKKQSSKNVSDTTFKVTVGIGNLTDNVGRDVTISGSRKTRSLFIYSRPLFSKNILLTFSGGFRLGLGSKGFVSEEIRNKK